MVSQNETTGRTGGGAAGGAAGRALRYGVVGGGIVGLAVARELLARTPGARVVVLEREDAIGRHQTTHNSGVAHAGVYYAAGSLKARLCTRGRELLQAYCAEHGIPYVESGKLIVAVEPSELARLDDLEARARANGVPGLRRVGPDEIRAIEPHAAGLSALHSPRTALVDFGRVAQALAADVVARGGAVRCGWDVVAIGRSGRRVRVLSDAGEALELDRLVLCGGLQSDRLAQLAGDGPSPRIVPFRGEYLTLKPARADLVRSMIYPVPDPELPFLGVHFTRRVDGTVDIGPNAVLALSRSGYRRTSVDVHDTLATLRFRGFWRLARRWWRFGADELAGSLSPRWHVRSARRYVPALTRADVVRGPVGIRAQAVDARGGLVDDFVIAERGPVVALRNAPSPAATSSLAIAEHVCDVLGA